MPAPGIVMIAALPILVRVLPKIIPGYWLEPYNLWSPASLNSDGSTWRNMGYWKDTTDYSRAGEALGQKLLEFADAAPGGVVLDMAHGAGDSLGLHLEQTPPPSELHALTSLPFESLQARAFIADKYSNATTPIEWYTSSASFNPGSILNHPLNPMKGFMGETNPAPPAPAPAQAPFEASPEKAEASDESPAQQDPKRYHLVYILDAIYHFPPTVPYFLASVLKVLAPGGVVAYTDIIPPSNLSITLSMVLPLLLSVPSKNIASRPKNLGEYKDMLERIGYENVRIEDWSENVWLGFATNLRERGGMWRRVGNAVAAAERSGWRFVAVRAQKPELQATD